MIRHGILFLLALLLFSSSLLSLVVIQQEEVLRLRGYVDPTEDANLPFRVPRLGVNVELGQYSEPELSSQLALMETVGITWVRQFVYWDEIEPIQGEFNWQAWDQLGSAIEKKTQLRLIVVFMNSPMWAQQSLAGSVTAPPKDIEAFAHFTRAFAERYGSIIDYYQIWDEPNLRTSWGGNNPSPVDYAALLASAYEAIHSADIHATVIAAALAPTVETGPHNISELRYLRDLYETGAQPYFDAIAGKPYGFNSSPLERTINESKLNFSRLITLRELLVEQGDSHKAVWAMNWGWNHLPENWNGNPSIWGQVTNQEQSRYTLEALDRVDREWPWLAGMIIQHWQPDASLDDPVWGFAIRGHNNEATTLLEAIHRYATPFVATNGLFEPSTSFASYSGVWSFSPLGADSGWVDGSRAQLVFKGTDISLLLRQGNYVAYLYPTIDGQPANMPPHDNAGNAYIVLTSGSEETETHLVSVANTLSHEQHTLNVVADRGWDQWPLVGYAVSSGNLHKPYTHLYIIALLSMLFSGILSIRFATNLSWKFIYAKIAGFNQWLAGIHKWIMGGAASIVLMLGMLLTWGSEIPSILRREPIHIGLSILTAGLVYVQLSFWITLISIAVLWWLIYNRIEIGLALAIFWSPFFLFPVELYRFAFPLTEVIILITISAWLVRSCVDWADKSKHNLSHENRNNRFHLLDKLVILWVALGVISLLWSEFRELAFTDLRVKLIEPALFYMIVRSVSFAKPHVIRYCIAGLIAAGLAISVIGLAQYVQGQAIITAEAGTPRLASVYGSPNNLGLFLGRCLPFVFTALLLVHKAWLRLLTAAIFVILGITTLLSQSAGALFVGVPASVALITLLIFKRRGLFTVLSIVIIGAFGLYFAFESPRFSRLLDLSSGTNFYRLRVWESAIDVIRDHPITGIGLDQFLYAFRGHYIRPDAWQEPNLSHPHNIILDFWVQLGIGGVLVLISIQYTFWANLWKQYIAIDANNTPYRIVVIGTMGSMANVIAHGLIDNSVYVNDLIFVFMLLLAIAASGPILDASDNLSIHLPTQRDKSTNKTGNVVI